MQKYTATARRVIYLGPQTAIFCKLWPSSGQTAVHTPTPDFPASVIYGWEYLKTLSTFVIAKLQCSISVVNWSLTAYSWPCVLHKVLFRKTGFKPQWKAISIRQWKERTTACIVNSEGLSSLSGPSAYFKLLLCCLNPVVLWSSELAAFLQHYCQCRHINHTFACINHFHKFNSLYTVPFLTVTPSSSAVTGRAGGCDKAAVIGATIKDIYKYIYIYIN